MEILVFYRRFLDKIFVRYPEVYVFTAEQDDSKNIGEYHFISCMYEKYFVNYENVTIQYSMNNNSYSHFTFCWTCI